MAALIPGVSLKKRGVVYLHPLTKEIMPNGEILAGCTSGEYILGFQWFLRQKFVEPGNRFYSKYKGHSISEFAIPLKKGFDVRYSKVHSCDFSDVPVYTLNIPKNNKRVGFLDTLYYSPDDKVVLDELAVTEIKAKGIEKDLVPIVLFTEETLAHELGCKGENLVSLVPLGNTSRIVNVIASTAGDKLTYHSLCEDTVPLVPGMYPRMRIWADCDCGSEEAAPYFKKHGGIVKFTCRDYTVYEDIMDLTVEGPVTPLFSTFSTQDDFIAWLLTIPKKLPKFDRNLFTKPDHISVEIHSETHTDAFPKHETGYLFLRFYAKKREDKPIATWLVRYFPNVKDPYILELENRQSPDIARNQYDITCFNNAFKQWSAGKHVKVCRFNIPICNADAITILADNVVESYLNSPFGFHQNCRGINLEASSPKAHPILRVEAVRDYGGTPLANRIFDRIIATLRLSEKDIQLMQLVCVAISDGFERKILTATKREYGGDEIFVMPLHPKKFRSYYPRITAQLLAGVLMEYNNQVANFADSEMDKTTAKRRFYCASFPKPHGAVFFIEGSEDVGYYLARLNDRGEQVYGNRHKSLTGI